MPSVPSLPNSFGAGLPGISDTETQVELWVLDSSGIGGIGGGSSTGQSVATSTTTTPTTVDTALGTVSVDQLPAVGSKEAALSGPGSGARFVWVDGSKRPWKRMPVPGVYACDPHPVGRGCTVQKEQCCSSSSYLCGDGEGQCVTNSDCAGALECTTGSCPAIGTSGVKSAATAPAGAITQENCLSSAVKQFGSKVKGSRPALVAGSWAHVPHGCSVQSTGDWAAHWNSQSSGSGVGYTPVTSQPNNMNKCCSSPSTSATSQWSPPQHVAVFDVEVGHDEIRVMRTDSWEAWRHQVVLRCYVCGTGDATMLAKVPGNKTTNMNTSATATVNPLAFTDDVWKKVKAPLYYRTSSNETATPSVSTVTPSSLNGAAGEDGIITLGGLGLRDLASVKIDGMDCVVTAVDKEDNTTDVGTVRTCAFKRIDHTGSGRFPLKLVTKGGGEGISRLCPEGECAGPQLDLWPSVTSLSPSAGSLKGGQVITVRGAGFPAQASRVTVLLGGKKCTVLSTSSEAITCVTPPSAVGSLAVNVNASTVDVSVTVGKGPAAHLSRKKNTRLIAVKGTRNNIALGKK